MNTSERITELSRTLQQAGEAHHQAFIGTDGEDPEWPIWYANHLYEPFRNILQKNLTRSRIVYCLIAAEQEHQARAPESKWSDYYAHHLIDCHGPAVNAGTDKLMLYYFPSCPFCQRVLRTIDRLGIEVELRNIRESSTFLEELIAERERSTVPVLRIASEDGDERWMPESTDIITYLEATYG